MLCHATAWGALSVCIPDIFFCIRVHNNLYLSYFSMEYIPSVHACMPAPQRKFNDVYLSQRKFQLGFFSRHLSAHHPYLIMRDPYFKGILHETD